MANDIFSAKRFGNYFVHDMRSAWSNFGLTMIILSCMPVIMYLMYGAFHMVISGSWSDPDSYSACRISALVVSIITLALSMPVKLYGKLTDKRQGSDWLMLPASRLEKYISMLLILLVVAPAVYLAIFCGTDAVISLIATGHASSIGSIMPDGFGNAVSLVNDNISIHINAPLEVWGSWIQTMLVFTLGAVWFKRSKVAKTFLVLILASMVISFAFTAILAHADMSLVVDNLSDIDENSAFKGLIYGGMALEAVIDIALAVALWFRLKTLKH